MDKANIQTIRKWTFLKKYLHAYTTIISNSFSQFFYIDVCAGKGKYDGHDGSPLIALNVEFPFTDYVFNEKDPNKLKELEQHVRQLPQKKALIKRQYNQKTRDITISFKNTDATDFIKKELNNLPECPCFIFIDPDGIEEIDMESISRCAQIKKVELFINFSISGVIRTVAIPRCHSTLTKFYGNEKWKNVKGVNKDQNYVDLYIESLKEHFGYVNYKKIKNNNNVQLYHLIHATNNEVGSKIMKDVIKMKDTQSKLNF